MENATTKFVKLGVFVTDKTVGGPDTTVKAAVTAEAKAADARRGHDQTWRFHGSAVVRDEVKRAR